MPIKTKVAIYDSPKRGAGTEPLQIAGGDIAFLLDPLIDQQAFTQTGKDHWHLRFFTGTGFEQVFEVCFFIGDDAPVKEARPLARACHLIESGEPRNRVSVVEEASMFLRGSRTLDPNKLTMFSAEKGLIADRDGIAYLSKNANQFRRIVLCQTLAVAYQNVLYACMNQLADNVRKRADEATMSLYERILRFNASSYFRQPVKTKMVELFPAWQVLQTHYRLDDLSQELMAQLTDVAALLRARQERELARRHTNRNYQLTALGLLLAVAALVA